MEYIDIRQMIEDEVNRLIEEKTSSFKKEIQEGPGSAKDATYAFFKDLHYRIAKGMGLDTFNSLTKAAARARQVETELEIYENISKLKVVPQYAASSCAAQATSPREKPNNPNENKNNNKQKNAKSCSHCKKNGHLEKDCWKKNQGYEKHPPNILITCIYCKKPGHQVKRCWKKVFDTVTGNQDQENIDPTSSRNGPGNPQNGGPRATPSQRQTDPNK